MGPDRVFVLAACLSFAAVATVIGVVRWVWARWTAEADLLRETLAEADAYVARFDRP